MSDEDEWRAALRDTPESERECYLHDWRPHPSGVLVCPVCGTTEMP
jgi:hypothetical protein